MGASSPSEYFFKLQVYHGREISRRITQDTLIMAGAEDHFVPLKHWWACLDSNQEPDRYERRTLSGSSSKISVSRSRSFTFVRVCSWGFCRITGGGALLRERFSPTTRNWHGVQQ